MFVRKSLIIAVIALCVSVYCIHYLYDVTNNSYIEKMWAVFVCGFSGITGAIFIDVYRRKISPFHTARSSFDHYLAVSSLSWIGWYMMRKLEKNTKDIVKTQETILLGRLKDNAETLYGKEHKFSEVKSREDYVKLHPLTRIDHYQPYIEKMMKGEVNILTAKQPIVFAVTSGTSGKSSIIPMTSKQRLLFFLEGITTIFDRMQRVYPVNKQLQKDMKLFFTPKWRMSEAGISIGPNSSSPTNSKALLNLYSTPKAGYEILSEPEALYVHLLFGLRDKDLGIIEANFASTVFTAFNALELNMSDLIDDIEKGRVNPKLNIELNIREQLDTLLSPDKERADEIREACKGGNSGLAKRIWPNCQLILCCDTGAFALQGDMLKETYCKGIPLFSPLYAASEGLLGINIWPEERPVKYLLAPTSMFFEFIPLENCEEDQPKTLFMDQTTGDISSIGKSKEHPVEHRRLNLVFWKRNIYAYAMHETKVDIGSQYELVITNAGGLCRYRFGDVVKVVSFHNQCPVIEFMYRQGQFLNVGSEKTSESAFYQALTEAGSQWTGVKVTDYCCAESVLLDKDQDNKSYAPFYHVFIELDHDDAHLTDEQRNMIDQNLCKQSYVYGSYRNKGSIQPMKVHLVNRGTFRDLRQFTIETTSASSNQYKCPRVLKRKETVDFILKRAKS